MDKNGNSLAIASVPCQKWKSTYDPQTSLKKGTVFPELNMPFFKADDSDEIPSGKGSADGKNPEQEEREALMAKIDEAGFVVNDLRCIWTPIKRMKKRSVCLRNMRTERLC